MAEEQDHHPDIFLAWGRVKVTIWTHKIDGLTESDFVSPRRRMLYEPSFPHHDITFRDDAIVEDLRVDAATSMVVQRRAQAGIALGRPVSYRLGRCRRRGTSRSRYCQVEADGRFWCPAWRVRDGLESSILRVTRRAFRQLANADGEAYETLRTHPRQPNH